MTFVGKILVVVISLFAMVFLGISVVVFSTHVNWKEAHTKEQDKVKKLSAQKSDLEASLAAEKTNMAKAASEHAAAVKAAEDKVTALDTEIKQAQKEITAAQSQLETAQKSAAVALAEAAQRRSETELLRNQKSEVEKQANEFKIQQTDLIDKIRDLERQSKTLDDNNKVLRDAKAKLSTLLRKNGLSDDISTVTGLESPPPVEGEIKKVDERNTTAEITIGSDDGLVAGHELNVYRLSPRPQYLGKIRIMTTDPDQAVGKVIGRTINGIKLKEGDIVSSTLRPRS